jgi:hypothetical protein
MRALVGPHIHRRSTFLAQEEVSEDCYKAGRRLLRRAIEVARGSPAFGKEAAGLARLYLADWDLMFNHQKWAEAGYGEAFETLAAADIPLERLRQFFGAPALLPEPHFHLALDAMENRVHDLGVVPDGTTPFVPWAREVPGVQFPPAGSEGFALRPAGRWALARFRVEGNGWVENIRIVDVYPENEGLSEDARKAIWYAQFRPRLENGRVAVTREVQVRYLPPQ